MSKLRSLSNKSIISKSRSKVELTASVTLEKLDCIESRSDHLVGDSLVLAIAPASSSPTMLLPNSSILFLAGSGRGESRIRVTVDAVRALLSLTRFVCGPFLPSALSTSHSVTDVPGGDLLLPDEVRFVDSRKYPLIRSFAGLLEINSFWIRMTPNNHRGSGRIEMVVTWTASVWRISKDLSLSAEMPPKRT